MARDKSIAAKAHAVRLLQSGDMNEVWQLLDSDVNIQKNGETALLCAAYKDDTKLGELLLDKGVDIHAGDDAALHIAVCNGHQDMTKLLLGRGANVHAQSGELLIEAVMRGNKEVVELLLEHGADPQAKREEGELFDPTAEPRPRRGEELRWAEKHGQTEIAALIREKIAAGTSAQGRLGVTPSGSYTADAAARDKSGAVER